MTIVILSSNDVSASYMIQGYLEFYCGKDIACVVADNGRNIHPLALQIMYEDGIDIAQGEIITPANMYTNTIDIIISINNAFNGYKPFDYKVVVHEIEISNPFKATKYNEVLHEYKLVRELLKKKAIEIAGTLLKV